MPSVLLLGSGFVAKPTVDVLSKTEGYNLTIGCRTLEKAQALAEGFKNTKAISIDVEDAKALDAEMAKVDLVISLIPYTYHVKVIESAIRFKKHVVTTSYISPAIQSLENEVKKAGIVVMNEIGLDPGIDHLYAVKTIDEVHKKGGKIDSFLSYCGGLPAPECSNNPLGYKFSWSSRGVLLALRNDAKFYQNGAISEINGKDLMSSAVPYFTGYMGYNFVAYPNRDSTGYKERYHIPEAQSIIRGTLRYDGFPQFVRALVDIGFLIDTPDEFLNPKNSSPPTWADTLAHILKSPSSKESDLIAAISSKTQFKSNEEKSQILNGFRWLDLFSTTVKVHPRGNPLDTLCATLEDKMQFENDERDLVFLQHKFGISWPNGKTETRTSTLVEYGIPNGYSAMARTVGIPCAIAVKQVLNGSISTPGLLAPLSPQINDPLMKELKDEYNIYCKEETLD